MFDITLYNKRKKELKLTYEDISRLSGVSRRTVAGMFSGDPIYQSPTITTIEAINRVLGISNDTDVFYTTGETVTPDEYDLLTNYRNMTAEDKKVLLYFSERLANFEQKK